MHDIINYMIIGLVSWILSSWIIYIIFIIPIYAVITEVNGLVSLILATCFWLSLIYSCLPGIYLGIMVFESLHISL